MLAPEAVETLSPPQGAGGQYLIVTSGEMLFEEAVFDRWSTVFVTADEDAFEVRAGSKGLDLVSIAVPATLKIRARPKSRPEMSLKVFQPLDRDVDRPNRAVSLRFSA